MSAVSDPERTSDPERDAASATGAEFEPRITAFVCNWCTYTGADLAGTSRLHMASNVRIIRLPCTGRIDHVFIVKAFERGADGVIVSGCHPADCHYTAGNYHARRRFGVFRELLCLPGRRARARHVLVGLGLRGRQVGRRGQRDRRRACAASGPFDAYHGLAGAAMPADDPFAGYEIRRRPPDRGRVVSELQDTARRLLDEGTVQVVIGWEDGRRGARPVFVTSAADCDRLIFDTRCVHNLATFLNPRRSQVTGLGKAAVVVKGCDAKAVAGLLREAQLERDGVVLIGVRCGGVVGEPRPSSRPRSRRDRRRRAAGAATCASPRSVDVLVGEAQPEPPVTAALDERVAALDALSPAERFAFWTKELSRCTQCYACRQACPLCFCERCIVEKTEPQWIETSPHPRGNFAWHLTRAQHLAGRCVGCGECERACPVGIPLGLINRKLQQVVYELYGYTVSEDPAVPAPIGAYAIDDTQEFIK